MMRSIKVVTMTALCVLASAAILCSPQLGLGSLSAIGTLELTATAQAESGVPADAAEQDAALAQQYAAAAALFDAKEYMQAYDAFKALGNYSDSRARASACYRTWQAASYSNAISLFKAESYDEATAIFEALDDYKDSRSYLYKSRLKGLQAKYRQASDMYSAGDYQGAQALFASLGSYHNSEERALEAAEQVKAQEQAAADLAAYQNAVALLAAGDLEGARDAFVQAGDCKDATEQFYTVIGLLGRRTAYAKAEAYSVSGDYENAYDLYSYLAGYQDSAAKAEQAMDAWRAAVYAQAGELQGSAKARACILYLSLGNYRDSATLAPVLQAQTTQGGIYAAADAYEQNGAFTLAKAGFAAVGDFQDAVERLAQVSETLQNTKEYNRALYLALIGEQAAANDIYKALGSFKHAAKLVVKNNTRITTKQLRDDKTTEKSAVFTAPDGTKHCYQIFRGVHTWLEAKMFCELLGGHLATLTTPEENDFVYQFMRDSGFLTAYFGLSDEERTGDWIWVTGEPCEYTNWHRGQPSYSTRERYGMYLYLHKDGTWNDSHFYETAKVKPGCSYICEWDLP